MSDDKPFFLRRRAELPQLERWLKGRSFNCGGQFGTDKKGNPMLSIGWDYHPNNDWKLPDKRGLIIVTDKADTALAGDVEAMIQNMAGASGHKGERT